MKKYIATMITMALLYGLRLQAYAHDYAMSFLYGGTNEQYINCVQNANGVLNSVSPDYFEITADGGLKHNNIDRHFISVMHEKGVKVVPFISNHWDRRLGQAAIEQTDTLTTELARAVYEYDLDGVNVDIENISDKQKDDYSYFVSSLRHKMPGKILCVSVAANPYGWQTGWHGSYDYKRLADNSDYLLVMGYDDSFYGSKPGPVASAEYTEKAIAYALNEVPPEKIVLGIPFFGRYWKQGDTVGGHGLTVMDINNLISRFPHRKVYHEDKQSAQVTVVIGKDDTPPKVWGGRILDAGVYDIWYDDMQATTYKLGLVNQYRLKGSGSWALGQDSTEMWNAYALYKQAADMGTDAGMGMSAGMGAGTGADTDMGMHTVVNRGMAQNSVSPSSSHVNNRVSNPPTITYRIINPNTSNDAQPISTQTTPPHNTIMNNTPMSTEGFDAHRYATRGEAIAMVMNMAVLLPDSYNMAHFADTAQHRYGADIRKAREYGIVTGGANGYFEPDSTLTRQDLALYLDRVFDLPDTINFEGHYANDLQKENNGERYYAVQKYLAHGILQTDANGNFRPEEGITLGELASVAQKLKGVGLKDLQPLYFDGQTQRQKILEPR